MKKIWMTLWITLALAACNQPAENHVSNETQPASEKTLSETQTFRSKVFIFIDEFNKKMRHAGVDASIAGAGVNEETVEGYPSLAGTVSPGFKVNWFSNEKGDDIKGFLITQDSGLLAKENGEEQLLVTYALLTNGIAMSGDEPNQFFEMLRERLGRLVEMNKLYKEGDPPQQTAFEFHGYKFILGFGGRYVMYSRERVAD